MKPPVNVVLERCAQAGDYVGEAFPCCGCKTCWHIWIVKSQIPREEFLEFLVDTSIAWNKFAKSAI